MTDQKLNESAIICIARARKDVKALKHALNCKVLSLGGVRSLENVEIDIPSNKILFFFCGKSKEEIELAKEFNEIASKYTISKIVVLSKKTVRNTRIEEIKRKFEIAKAEIRLSLEWDANNKIFKFSDKNSLNLEIHPDFDTYFVCSKLFAENMNEIFGIDIKYGNIILRKKFNEEWIYSPCLKAIVSKKTGEKLKTIYKSKNCTAEEISLKKIAKFNEEWIKKFEEIAISFLRDTCILKNYELNDAIYVPFSGGKDSLTTLILSCKAFTKDKVKAVYIKTNHELPYTEEYVEDICEKLGVELIKGEVRFNEANLDRICTKIKLQKLREISGKILIVGDRDAESKVRRLRREIVQTDGKVEIHPIKYWSGCLIQLYITKNKFDLHPLYIKGFYRLGCKICPFMGEWERKLLS